MGDKVTLVVGERFPVPCVLGQVNLRGDPEACECLFVKVPYFGISNGEHALPLFLGAEQKLV
jgi:hypothetical protein